MRKYNSEKTISAYFADLKRRFRCLEEDNRMLPGIIRRTRNLMADVYRLRCAAQIRLSKQPNAPNIYEMELQGFEELLEREGFNAPWLEEKSVNDLIDIINRLNESLPCLSRVHSELQNLQ